MKALILDGSLPGDDATEVAGEVLIQELEGAGWQVDRIVLRDVEMAGCRGCFGCWDRTPGLCVIDDDGRQVPARAIQSDLLVYLTPVTFGGYSSQLKKGLDRIICIVHPFFMKVEGEFHHQPRYDRYPRLLGVGVLPGPDHDSEEIFETLVKRNAINLLSPARAAGVVYRDQSTDAVRQRIAALLAEVEVSP